MKHWYWRGLLDTLAIVLAIPGFGLLGAAVVGLILRALWKWPKARSITAGVMAIVFLVGTVAFAGYRAPVQAAPAPAAATAAPRSQWDRDANAFEAAHPDIKMGQNEGLVQEKLNEFADPKLSNAALLQKAYAAAALSSRWTRGSQVAQPTTPTPSAPPTLSYLQMVTKDAMDCQRHGRNVADCFVTASPKRCKQAAVTFIGSSGSDSFDFNRHVWAVCVNSCKSASAWSKIAGDCHRG